MPSSSRKCLLGPLHLSSGAERRRAAAAALCPEGRRGAAARCIAVTVACHARRSTPVARQGCSTRWEERKREPGQCNCCCDELCVYTYCVVSEADVMRCENASRSAATVVDPRGPSCVEYPRPNLGRLHAQDHEGMLQGACKPSTSSSLFCAPLSPRLPCFPPSLACSRPPAERTWIMRVGEVPPQLLREGRVFV